MDSDVIIFWMVVFSCVTPLAVTLSRWRSARGWPVVYAAILLVELAGKFWEGPALIYGGFAGWLLLVLTPALLSRMCHREVMMQRYARAIKIARIMSCLHPADGLREQPEVIRALALAHQGRLDEAKAVLGRFQKARSAVGLAATVNLFRLTSQWDELLAWQAQHVADLRQYPQLLHVILRAHGETGDRRGLVALYASHRGLIARLAPVAARDHCRLMLFAFCGRRDLVEKLLGGSLSIFPAVAREFWLATADEEAGNPESARQQYERLLALADPAQKPAIERRLARMSLPPPLPADDAESVIQEIALEHSHDESFGARPSLLSRHGRCTRWLIALNLIMFVIEAVSGGATDLANLLRLGALYGPAVRAGEWWRLVASLFLHYGALHVTMNMIGLWVLGPFVEFALGFRRFLALYLVAGVGSMAFIMQFASGPDGLQVSLGASGCIMGLVGATGALMLRGWRREKAMTARRRLIVAAAIVLSQTMFDSLVPQVSMAGHLSGTVIGFVTALLMPDRLSRADSTPAAAAGAPKSP